MCDSGAFTLRHSIRTFLSLLLPPTLPPVAALQDNSQPGDRAWPVVAMAKWRSLFSPLIAIKNGKLGTPYTARYHELSNVHQIDKNHFLKFLAAGLARPAAWIATRLTRFTHLVGLEPTASGFGNLRSTN